MNSDLVKDLMKYSNPSVFRIDDNNMIERIVSAVKKRYCGSKNCVLVIIDGWIMWIEPEASVGRTPDSKVNNLHYEYKNLDDNCKVMLANAIYHGEGIPYDDEEVKIFIRTSEECGYFDC